MPRSSKDDQRAALDERQRLAQLDLDVRARETTSGAREPVAVQRALTPLPDDVSLLNGADRAASMR